MYFSQADKSQSSNKNKGDRIGAVKSNVLHHNSTKVFTKEYNLKAEWKPHVNNTHWKLFECNLFNKDGSKKDSACPYIGGGGGGKTQYNTTLYRDLDTQKIKLKKLERKYKR